MNAFSSSRQAGDLVAQITVCVLVAFVVGTWAYELWAATRPHGTRKPLRVVYWARRVPEVRNASAVLGVPELRTPIAGVEPCVTARLSGVDELSIDDLSLWAQRTR